MRILRILLPIFAGMIGFSRPTPAQTPPTVPDSIPASLPGTSSPPVTAPKTPSPPAVPVAAVTPAVVRRLNGIQADLSLGVIGLAYERVVNDFVTLHIGAQYFRPWYTGQPVHGAGGELRAVFSFFHGPAPRGLYISPFVRMAWLGVNTNLDPGTGFSWSTGVTLGYSLLLGGWFNARLGPGIQYFSHDVRAGADRYTFSSFYPALDIMISVFF